MADQCFFLCIKCRTHIAHVSACVFFNREESLGIFEDDLVNVKVDEEDKSWFENSSPPARTYVQVYCNGCQAVLGKQMFAVEQEDVVSRDGRFLMYMRRLMLWDGVKLVYADNGEEVYVSKQPVIE